MVFGDDVAEILNVEACGKCGGADEIAEHYCQLPAFRGRRTDNFRQLYGRFTLSPSAQQSDCGEQLAAMPDEVDAEVLEVFGGQLRQDRRINGVVAKRLLVLLQSKAVKPGCDVQAFLPDAAPPREPSLPRILALRDGSARLVAAKISRGTSCSVTHGNRPFRYSRAQLHLSNTTIRRSINRLFGY
jgi:hypothetical protein